jgi:hypothetical protein
MRSAFVKKFAGSVLVALAMLTLSATSAFASHFRYGTIVWTQQTTPTNPRVVTFQITSSWRRSFGWVNATGTANITPNVGTVISGSSNALNFFFGDGLTAVMDITVTSVDSTNDWFTGTSTVTHVYSATNTFTAYFFNCCRLSPPTSGNLDGTQNNTDASFYVWTRVNTGVINHPPSVSTPPIVTLAANRPDANFPLFADDLDGNPLTYRLATQAEQCGPATLGPTCSTSLGTAVSQPPSLFVDSLGVVHFNTQSPRVPGQVWNTQIVVSDNTSSTVVDLLIKLVNVSSQPPVSQINGSPNSITFAVKPLVPFTFTATGTDPDPGATVTLTTSGVPIGASFSPTLPTAGLAPRSTTFTWTPTLAQAGFSYGVNIITTDNTGLQDVNQAIIQVLPNLKPTTTCPVSPLTVPAGPSGTADVTVSLPVDDSDGDALSVLWKFGAILWDSVTVPKPANVSLGTHATVTLHKLALAIGTYSNTQITISDNITSPATACSLTVEVTKAPQTISFDDIADQNYGDGPITLVATATSGLDVTFSVVAGPASIAGDQLTLTGVGPVTVQASQAGNAIYAAAPSVIQTFNVGEGTPVVTAAGGTFTYNASPHAGSGSATGVGGVDLGPVTLTYDGSPSAPSDAGSYEVVASYGGSALYNAGTSAPATLVIGKATPTVTAADATADYDGNPHGTTASVTGVGGVTLTPVLIYYDGSTDEPVDAGSYTVKAVYGGSANYNTAYSALATLTINKADPIVNATGGTFTYDGNSHAGSGSATGVGGVDLGDVTLTYNGSSDQPMDAGSYDVVASYAGSANYNARFSGPATLVIGKADPTMSATGGTFTYDAVAHPGSGSATGIGGVDLGAVTVTYDGSASAPIEAGTHHVLVEYAASGNYNEGSATATIEIGKADPTVSATGGTFTYNAAAYLGSGSATGIGGVGLGAVMVTYDGSASAPVDAGTHHVLVEYAGNNNYNPGSATADLVIGKADPTVTATGGTFTYNSAAHPGSGSATGIGGVDLGAVTITYDGSSSAPVTAGTHHVLVEFAGNDNYNGGSATATIEIGKADPTVSAIGGTFTYDSTAHSGSGSAKGVFGEDLGAVTITYGGSSIAPVNAGSYGVLVSFGGNSSYNPGTATATIEIGKADPTGSVSGGTFSYNSLAHPSTATIGGVGGVSLGPVTITYNGAAAAPVNGGSYAVLASFAGNGNYNSATRTNTTVINAVALTVAADNKSKVAGQPNPTLTATFTGLQGSDTFAPAITTTATAASPVGTYSITVTPFTSPNYNITYVAGTLTVNPARQMCLDYDPTKAANSGSTIPIKIRLCDMSGNNISSSSIVLTAVNVTPAGGGAAYPAQDPGNSNPGNVFKYQSNGYHYNLKTTGLPSGVYHLNISVSGDPSGYFVEVRIR